MNKKNDWRFVLFAEQSGKNHYFLVVSHYKFIQFNWIKYKWINHPIK